MSMSEIEQSVAELQLFKCWKLGGGGRLPSWIWPEVSLQFSDREYPIMHQHAIF